MKRIFFSFALLISVLSIANAQNIKPYTINLSEDGSRYIKFGVNLQVWGRYTELNPNSKIGSDTKGHAYDIVIRRLRMQALGMLTKKVFFHFQLGQNNINFVQNKGPYHSPISVFDLLGEYHFAKYLHVGGGMTGWSAGTTRFSAQSSATQIPADAPIYQQNNISGVYGNRNLSIYAKGEFSKFTYRFAVTNPYEVSTSNIGTAATASTLTPNANYTSMLTYQFLEKESIAEPYNKGTYMGTKKVLNVAIGYMTQSKATWRLSETNLTDTILEDMNVFGADVFYDTPLNKKGAGFTFYAAYNYCDYGKNYTRMLATPNPASSGTGSGFLGIGTGNIYYTQIGYLMNKSKNEEKPGRAQFYLASKLAALQALKTPMTMYEVGVNYYLTGTFGSRVTLGYQNRGIFETVAGEEKQVASDRKSMVVLQYQVSF